jgi:hypothetical protein
MTKPVNRDDNNFNRDSIYHAGIAGYIQSQRAKRDGFEKLNGPEGVRPEGFAKNKILAQATTQLLLTP